MKARNLDKCTERDKCVLVLMDEMHVKRDIVYDKHSGEIVGFANLGDINKHLLELEELVSSEGTSTEPPAKTMLQLMVKGLFRHLEFPYAYFPCSDPTADLLFDPFWDAVYRLERIGFKVAS